MKSGHTQRAWTLALRSLRPLASTLLVASDHKQKPSVSKHLCHIFVMVHPASFHQKNTKHACTAKARSFVRYTVDKLDELEFIVQSCFRLKKLQLDSKRLPEDETMAARNKKETGRKEGSSSSNIMTAPSLTSQYSYHTTRSFHITIYGHIRS